MQKDRYPVVQNLILISRILDISPERVLQRAGLPRDLVHNEGKGVTAAQFFSLFNAMDQEAEAQDLPIKLGRAFAKGPTNAAMFAFSCSPNTEEGIKRLSLFKPLVAPCDLGLERLSDSVVITTRSADLEHPMPPRLAAFEMVFFTELIRNHTMSHVVPLAVNLPSDVAGRARLDRYFGVASGTALYPSLTLSLNDAHRPLFSENAALWAGFEDGLKQQMDARKSETPITIRVQSALMDLLPAGHSSIDAVCGRLHISRRSLQRHLKQENTSFQAILDHTRSKLSLHYLARPDMSVEDISYLLAYRDPNSFYRAFQNWTGKTPMQARQDALH
ncbi:helix-turn-helix domain-containing protein [Aestuariibius sp. HNIBRBA575]|uniref:helix-turn-helix domain-containing protein n=1 Tax=Aestuariibius sp. HNIBRBA575 TaxID=3233343 RepID=UPI0034A25A2E